MKNLALLYLALLSFSTTAAQATNLRIAIPVPPQHRALLQESIQLRQGHRTAVGRLRSSIPTADQAERSYTLLDQFEGVSQVGLTKLTTLLTSGDVGDLIQLVLLESAKTEEALLTEIMDEMNQELEAKRKMRQELQEFHKEKQKADALLREVYEETKSAGGREASVPHLETRAGYLIGTQSLEGIFEASGMTPITAEAKCFERTLRPQSISLEIVDLLSDSLLAQSNGIGKTTLSAPMKPGTIKPLLFRVRIPDRNPKSLALTRCTVALNYGIPLSQLKRRLDPSKKQILLTLVGTLDNDLKTLVSQFEEALKDPRCKGSEDLLFDASKFLIHGVNRMSDILGVAETQDILAATGDKLVGMNEMSEAESLRIQKTIDRRSKFISTLSNVMKKVSTTRDTLVQNIK